MSLHNLVAAPGSRSEDGEHIPMSSWGLGWSALNFERRESRRGSRELPQGSRRHLIYVVLSRGRVVGEAEGRRLDLELAPGRVVVIPARTPVRWSWSSRIASSVLMLETAVVERVAQEVFGLAPHEHRLIVAERRNDSAIATVAGVLTREAISRDPGGRLYSESLANMLSVHLLRHYAKTADGRALKERTAPEEQAPSPSSQPYAVSQAVQFIDQNYSRDLTLRDIAAAVHLSPFHVSRLFKRVLGVSPHQYLIQVRVNSARSLLSTSLGQRSIAEVASAAGFADQSHLTRQFKRMTGMTPHQYRGSLAS